MASSTTTGGLTVSRHPFTTQVEAVQIPKSDVNALILDYLTVSGYPDAAAKFSTEANLPPQQHSSAVVARQFIQTAIHGGDIATAIDAINDIDPSILDEDGHLHFALLRLQLVELIRACTASSDGDITPALDFATAQLGPRASLNSDFLDDLERTMTLVVFPHDSLDAETAALLDPSLRREVAHMVNRAILIRQGQRRDAAIRHLLTMRAWAEASARKEKVDLPRKIDLGLDNEDVDEPMT